MGKFDYSDDENLISSSEYDKRRTINVAPEVKETEAGSANEGVLIACTVSPGLKIAFWVLYGLLAAFTIVWILMGHLDQTYVYLIFLVILPFIFRFLTVTKTLFRTEGIEMYGRILPWDAVSSMSVNEEARKIYVTTADEYIRTIRVSKKVTPEEYAAMQAYAKRMLTLSADRIARRVKDAQ